MAPARRVLSQDEAGAGAAERGPGVAVENLPTAGAEATAADALVQLRAGAGQQLDPRIELTTQRAADSLPIRQRRRTPVRERGKRALDLGQPQSQLLDD